MGIGDSVTLPSYTVVIGMGLVSECQTCFSSDSVKHRRQRLLVYTGLRLTLQFTGVLCVRAQARVSVYIHDVLQKKTNPRIYCTQVTKHFCKLQADTTTDTGTDTQTQTYGQRQTERRRDVRNTIKSTKLNLSQSTD